jgi:hypothetical protein
MCYGAEFGGFAPRTDYGVGETPQTIAVADFNGDGAPDIASENTDSDDMSVLINNGDGTFGAANFYPCGNTPISIAAGDLDGDGDADITVANGNGTSISIFFGNGDGTFFTHQTYEFDPNLPPYPGVIITHTMADFDGDNDIDIAVVTLTGTTIMILPNDGTGTFNSHQIIAYHNGPGFPVDLVPADFDGDGDVDLMTVTGYFLGHGPGWVLFNNGDAPWTYIEFEPEGDGIVDPPADFNGDGILDIAFTRTINPGGYITVALGNGDGTFGPQTQYDVERPGYPMTTADIDLDGDIDLIVTSFGPYRTVSVLLGHGDGTFDEPLAFPGVGAVSSPIAADFNGDSFPDVATANRGKDNVSVFLNQTQFELPLDIKPGACPNPLNRGSMGLLPVAVLGTMEFDVADIDASTIEIARADGVGGTVAAHKAVYEDVATPLEGEPCDCQDLGPDGYMDLLLKFKTRDLVSVLELDDLAGGESVELVVSGAFTDGAPFAAYDCIRVVGNNVRWFSVEAGEKNNTGASDTPFVPR